jgi:hypothetical protein
LFDIPGVRRRDGVWSGRVVLSPRDGCHGGIVELAAASGIGGRKRMIGLAAISGIGGLHGLIGLSMPSLRGSFGGVPGLGMS